VSRRSTTLSSAASTAAIESLPDKHAIAKKYGVTVRTVEGKSDPILVGGSGLPKTALGGFAASLFCYSFLFWELMHIVVFSLREVSLNPFPDLFVFYFSGPLFCCFK
jgi:hypothetical protein